MKYKIYYRFSDKSDVRTKWIDNETSAIALFNRCMKSGAVYASIRVIAEYNVMSDVVLRGFYKTDYERLVKVCEKLDEL